jgi:hypothetical protein
MRNKLLLLPVIPVVSAFLFAGYLGGPLGPGGCGPAAPPASGTGPTSKPQDVGVGTHVVSPGAADAGPGTK